MLPFFETFVRKGGSSGGKKVSGSFDPPAIVEPLPLLLVVARVLLEKPERVRSSSVGFFQ
jgi:hypothetical protein